MRNKMIWVFSIVLLCVTIAPVAANAKKGKKEIKEKRIVEHNPGCTCGGEPPKPPKIWFWFNWK